MGDRGTTDPGACPDSFDSNESQVENYLMELSVIAAAAAAPSDSREGQGPQGEARRKRGRRAKYEVDEELLRKNVEKSRSARPEYSAPIPKSPLTPGEERRLLRQRDAARAVQEEAVAREELGAKLLVLTKENDMLRTQVQELLAMIGNGCPSELSLTLARAMTKRVADHQGTPPDDTSSSTSVGSS
eukprot:m51a1_g753 hypothetical protein (187) ;mRNA; r:527546-528231